MACVAAGPQAVIRTGSGEARFDVEIADTGAARQRGLMGRESLDAGDGMVFLWSEDTDSAFYMRDTRMPLDIAFFDRDGRILRILTMTPCPADPCPVYSAGAPYRGALEVNAGALARAGVREGDRIEVRR